METVYAAFFFRCTFTVNKLERLNFQVCCILVVKAAVLRNHDGGHAVLLLYALFSIFFLSH